jgi:lipoprotein signal peptidase
MNPDKLYKLGIAFIIIGALCNLISAFAIYMSSR